MGQVNPLLAEWSTPLGLPPFADIRAEDFEPAFDVAMAEHLAEIEGIAAQAAAPTFENTVLALDRVGQRLARVSRVFHNLCSAETNPELQAVERTMAPKLAAHWAKVSLNEGVFARLDALHREREELGLDPVQVRLLERFHLDLVRSGALLTGTDRERVAALSTELAELHTRFSQNVLADESSWHLVLETEEDREGLPEWLLDAARGAAAHLGLPAGTAVITLSRSLVTPFLEHSTRRDLRARAFDAWIRRGETGGSTDNRELIVEILRRRAELARLHGYATYTDFQLADTMAGTASAVDGLLRQVWAPARSAALAEYEELQALARAAGDGEVEAADWRFWAERVRQERHRLDDDEIKPYFPLDAVLAAALDCASRLFGLTFRERPTSPCTTPTSGPSRCSAPTAR